MRALLLASLLLPARAAAEPFRGEDCARCHASIRDRSAPPAGPPTVESRSYDVAVVGAGFAGLSAAYFLKDLDVVVLEKEDKAGGHGRSESWRGIGYPTATVYFNTRPHGVWAALFDQLGVSPVTVKGPFNTLAIQGRKVHEYMYDGVGELPYSDETKDAFRRLAKDLEAFVAQDAFAIPVSRSKPSSWKLDKTTFRDWLTRRYGGVVAEHAGRVVSDMLGSGSREISAFAGLTMLASGDDYFTWPDGFSPVVEALESRLRGRVRTGSLVTSVEQDEDGVWVQYERGGKTFRLRAKTVLWAAPAHVALRVVRGLSPEKEQALSKVRYSVYTVAMLGFREPVWRDSYMIWGEDTVFTSLLFTDWPKRPSKPGPQVGLAYMPMGSEAARKRLLNTRDEALRRRLMTDLERVLPGASRKVEEVRIIRWGHAEPIPYPGYLSEVRPKVAAPMGRVFFAGEATEIPAMEGAIFSADRAASEIRSFLRRT